MEPTQVVHGLDWTQAITVFAIIATNLGTVIALYLHNDKKIEESRKETNEILKGIREDMNQFHNAMMQFHGRVCTLEGKGKK
jgi:adenine-specific DNA glycosylase